MMTETGLLAAVRIRGLVKAGYEHRHALSKLRLGRTNHCVLLAKNPVNEGMLKKVSKYVAWGEIEKEMLKALVAKRGRDEHGKPLEAKDVGKAAEHILKSGFKDLNLKPVFRLTPPSGGFKAVRLQYPRGDAGHRGKEINALLKRMI